MTQAAANTGVGPTALVGVEQTFPPDQRIVVDEIAARILPFSARLFVTLMRLPAARNWLIRTIERRLPGLWSAMMCRKRYIDDKLAECVDHLEAVVNLGAGFDTRAYRLPALSKIPIWELDQTVNIDAKRARVEKILGVVPGNVRLVPIDFDRQKIDAALLSSGYSTTMRSFFIWEGVTQYLTEAGVRATFDFLATARAGSRLAFTYVRKDFIDGQVMYGGDRLYEWYVVRDNIWMFGMDPGCVSEFLDQYGWGVCELADYEHLADVYVKPTGRSLAAAPPIEEIVLAEKQ